MDWKKFLTGLFLKIAQTVPKRKMSRSEAADVIDRFVHNKKMGDWEWDDFCCSNVYADPFLQRVVDECIDIHEKFPAIGDYCSAEGYARLLELKGDLLANPEEV
jgi:hypothetical protein